MSKNEGNSEGKGDKDHDHRIRVDAITQYIRLVNVLRALRETARTFGIDLGEAPEYPSLPPMETLVSSSEANEIMRMAAFTMQRNEPAEVCRSPVRPKSENNVGVPEVGEHIPGSSSGMENAEGTSWKKDDLANPDGSFRVICRLKRRYIKENEKEVSAKGESSITVAQDHVPATSSKEDEERTEVPSKKARPDEEKKEN